MPSKRTGTRSTSKNPTRETQGLTKPSSATATGGVKRGVQKLAPPPVAVRWSALLGAWNSESGEREPTAPGGGMTGAAAGKRRTGAGDDPGRQTVTTERTGTSVTSENKAERTSA